MSLIVAAVDGSEQSRRALMWALRYAVGRDAIVQAVMAVDTKNMDDAERQARLEQAEHLLSGMVTRAVQACTRPPTVTYEVVDGDPSVVLVDATHRAELIVFGSHRMSSLRSPALGTVSLDCIRLGDCPVLVIPAGHAEPSPCGDLVPPEYRMALTRAAMTSPTLQQQCRRRCPSRTAAPRARQPVTGRAVA